MPTSTTARRTYVRRLRAAGTIAAAIVLGSTGALMGPPSGVPSPGSGAGFGSAAEGTPVNSVKVVSHATRPFPNGRNSGVPRGTRLTAYRGPCTITTNGKVIEAKLIPCDLHIRASNVVIRKSRIRGTVSTDENSNGYSFTISQSDVFVGDRPGTGIGAKNFKALRVHVRGGNRSIHCWDTCVVRNSYVHAQFTDETGTYHESGIRMGRRARIVHNTIACDAPDVPPDAGCSAPLTGYGDFAPVERNLIRANLFKASPGGTCAYGGSSGGKRYSNDANNIRFVDNVFERGQTGKCGYWSPIMDFDRNAPGNDWSGNVWRNGGRVRLS